MILFLFFITINKIIQLIKISYFTDLCVLKFGEEIHELIIFYIYESKSPDGSVKAQLKDGEGRFIKLDTSEDLWNLIVKINPNIDPK